MLPVSFDSRIAFSSVRQKIALIAGVVLFDPKGIDGRWDEVYLVRANRIHSMASHRYIFPCKADLFLKLS